MSKPNITIYEGYTENKFRLLILPLQHCGHEGARACQVCWLWQGTDTICRHSLSTHRLGFIMFKKIENTTACDMRSVICFLNVKNMKLAEICQLCDLYGEHAMSSSMVWRWVQLFNEGHENVHDELWSCGLSVVNEDLVHTFEEKIRENRWFTIRSLSLHFPQISLSLLNEIVSDKLKFRKFLHTGCQRCLRKDTI